MQVRRLTHVSIAVPSIDAVLPFYCDILGFRLVDRRSMPARGLNVAFVEAGGDQIELLEPAEPDGLVARFLTKRGPGLHHVCLGVANLETALAELDARGVELIDRQATPGAHGPVAFLHPRAAQGVLLELQEVGDE